MSVSYEAKILPNQHFNNNLYQGKADYVASLFTLLHGHAIAGNDHTFKLNEHHRVPFQEMSTPPMQLALLKFLMDITQGTRFLEIGCFVGNTSMHMARHIGEQADVVTIEKFDEFADIAEKNFEQNGLSKNITLLRGDANEVMKGLKDNYFDLIYVDGDKGKYLELTKIAEQKISDRGIILVDDVFFHGDALNETPQTDKGLGCKKLLEYYQGKDHISHYLMPINNGILLLRKKPAAQEMKAPRAAHA